MKVEKSGQEPISPMLKKKIKKEKKKRHVNLTTVQGVTFDYSLKQITFDRAQLQ